MSVAVRHDRRRAGFPPPDTGLLDDPEAQPIIKRLGAAVDPDYPNRVEHVLRVAAIALAAKRRPNNAYAKATL